MFTVFSSASGKSANSSTISFSERKRLLGENFLRLSLATYSAAAIHTNASCASYISASKKNASLVATRGILYLYAKSINLSSVCCSVDKPIRAISIYRRSANILCNCCKNSSASSIRFSSSKRPIGPSTPPVNAIIPALYFSKSDIFNCGFSVGKGLSR